MGGRRTVGGRGGAGGRSGGWLAVEGKLETRGSSGGVTRSHKGR